METQGRLDFDSRQGSKPEGEQAHGHDYEGFTRNVGTEGMRLLFEIVDQATATKELPEFQADPFGRALEAAITARLERIKTIWPNLDEPELLRRVKEYAGRVAAHARSVRTASPVLSGFSRRRALRNRLIRTGGLSPFAPPNFCPPVSTAR